MVAYDLAAGITGTGLNALLAGLYAQPDARAHLFKGAVEQSTPLGEATCTFDLTEVPTLRLSGPSDAEWAHAQKPDPTKDLPARPTQHAFTVTMTGLHVAVTLAGVPQATTGTVQAFGVASAVGGTLAIDLVTVGVDESDFSMMDQILVNMVVIPEVMKMARGMLGGIPLPQVPALAGFTFAPLALEVTPAGVAVATSRTGTPEPDVSGFDWPGEDVFVLASFAAMNAGISAMLAPKYVEEDKTGSDAFTAAGRVTASDVSLVMSSVGGEVSIAIDGHFEAYGELSGVGVGITKAVLCPIGAAADAIADPGKWDKVISEFSLVYKPEPLPIVVHAKAGGTDGIPPSQKLSFEVDPNAVPADLSLLIKPEWSGSVTGSALSAAASAFVDLISAIFRKQILNLVREEVAENGRVRLLLPTDKMTKAISLPGGVSVTAALSATPGPALRPFGETQLKQALDVTIS